MEELVGGCSSEEVPGLAATERAGRTEMLRVPPFTRRPGTTASGLHGGFQGQV